MFFFPEIESLKTSLWISPPPFPLLGKEAGPQGELWNPDWQRAAEFKDGGSAHSCLPFLSLFLLKNAFFCSCCRITPVGRLAAETLSVTSEALTKSRVHDASRISRRRRAPDPPETVPPPELIVT